MTIVLVPSERALRVVATLIESARGT